MKQRNKQIFLTFVMYNKCLYSFTACLIMLGSTSCCICGFPNTSCKHWKCTQVENLCNVSTYNIVQGWFSYLLLFEFSFYGHYKH